MEKVVDKGIKIDMHIHSVFSKKKDGKKVAENTKNNLNILTDKLNKNSVNMCAITDHDNFNFELYAKLKEEEKNDNSIRKVLPSSHNEPHFCLLLMDILIIQAQMKMVNGLTMLF